MWLAFGRTQVCSTRARLRRSDGHFEGSWTATRDDCDGYFVLAGQHWFPAPNECLHHEDRFYPWHRVYVTKFEDALSSVPGAESVTLPYWDITRTPPDFLFDPPFDAYVLPVAIHPGLSSRIQ